MLFILAALVVIVVTVGVAVFITRSAEPESMPEALPSRVKGHTVMNIDLVGLSPDEAKVRLGYPDNDPIGAQPKIIGQDASVDLNAPTIITTVCLKQRDHSGRTPGTLVFEVANPGQLSAHELAALKYSTYQVREQHIKNVTGCESNQIGAFIPTPG